MEKNTRIKVPKQPLVFGSFLHWLRMLHRNGGIDRKYIGMAALVTLTSLLFSPLTLLENIIYARRIKHISITRDKAPVFILGHWRSGTTHLHNLMSKDPNFGFLTMYQSLAPGFFIVGKKFIRPLIKSHLPDTRPMDKMQIDLDYPQEEEFALGNLCAYSVSQLWHFPRRMTEHFHKWALFDGISLQMREKWKKIYIKMLKKAMFAMDAKRLIIKNPSNTARIKLILEMFPGAKFVHIHRNPLDVYVSTLNLHRKVMDDVAFQVIDEETLRNNTLEIYKKMFERFEHERSAIPEGDYVELRYEDLDKNPIEQLRHVYQSLALPGFDQAEPRFRDYLDSQESFEKNTYEVNDETKSLVRQQWGFAFDQWGYE